MYVCVSAVHVCACMHGCVCGEGGLTIPKPEQEINQRNHNKDPKPAICLEATSSTFQNRCSAVNSKFFVDSRKSYPLFNLTLYLLCLMYFFYWSKR